MAVPQYTPLANFDDIPGQLPAEGSVPANVDKLKTAHDAVGLLNSLLESALHACATWRDLLALTGYFRTFAGPTEVYSIFKTLSQSVQRSEIKLHPGANPVRLAKSGTSCSWLDVDVVFTVRHGNVDANCMGTVSVIPNSEGKWFIWMLRTWLESFQGHGNPDVPIPGSKSQVRDGHTNQNESSEHEEFDAVVVGGGQAGLSTAGRLQALGVNYILLERHAAIGDTWANRYDSLRWHTSKEYGVLPFGHTFPHSDDYCLPTKRIAAGHKAWAETYGINVRVNSLVESAAWSDEGRKWTIQASTQSGHSRIKAKNLVLCIGPGHAKPIVPDWATPSRIHDSGFRGTILHAFDGYKSADSWAGKRGVVIGTANTAHDVAEDMANAGMETTMVQRSPTFVFPAEWLHAAEDVHYHADMSAEDADKESFTYPNKILREMINRAVWAGISGSPDRFDALEKAGFQLDRYGDIYDNLYVRFGGHYVDIGASARIAKGDIKVKGRPVERLTEDGLLFDDGEELGADLIVLATGFDHVFRRDAARIIGREAADQMDEFWGVDAEGEIRGHAKPAGHPNLYYHGGDVRMARFFSRFIALQIQADVLGQPLQPYRD